MSSRSKTKKESSSATGSPQHKPSSNKSEEKKKSTHVFFEKQKEKTLCRMHAINNALGRKALTPEKFYACCDTFDMTYHCRGSREFFFLLNNEAGDNKNSDNLLSFILMKKFRIPSSFISFTKEQQEEENESVELFDDEDCGAFLCFSQSHIWAYRRVGSRWYCLDSLAPKPVVVKRHTISDVEGAIKLFRPPTKQTVSSQKTSK